MLPPSSMPRVYFAVFVLLIALTGATVGLSYVDLGRWHAAAGLCIAGAKAVLIAWFFMHLRDDRLTVLAILGGLFWLAILIGLTLTDVLSRDLPT